MPLQRNTKKRQIPRSTESEKAGKAWNDGFHTGCEFGNEMKNVSTGQLTCPTEIFWRGVLNKDEPKPILEEEAGCYSFFLNTTCARSDFVISLQKSRYSE